MSTPFNVPAGYTEASAPELFKFERIGDSIEGILLRAKIERILGDDVLELYISTGRSVKKIRPGFDIRQKLNRSHVGKQVLIRYGGDDSSKGTADNPMKVFGVYFKQADPTRESGDPGITDDDIPF